MKAIVVSPIKHNGRFYPVDSEISFTKDIPDSLKDLVKIPKSVKKTDSIKKTDSKK